MSIAIPVRNGGAILEQTLAAVRAQRLQSAAPIELIVCDSGSKDDSVSVARGYGAEVIEISPESFSHGGTRNLLMERSAGAHVAFLSQDAVPGNEGWLQRLLEGFSLAENVGLVFGPYLPRPDASPMVARELVQWFGRFSPDGRPRIDRLAHDEWQRPARDLLGPRGFFTDANGCVARAAWNEVPFRRVAYAEDHFLAVDMLRAGFAKAYIPDAAVIHSHEYSGRGWLGRSFDEGRALADVYGHSDPIGLRRIVLSIWGQLGADWRWAREHERQQSMPFIVSSAYHHTMRMIGGMLGARAARLPDMLVRRLSLERRAGDGGHGR